MISALLIYQQAQLEITTWFPIKTMTRATPSLCLVLIRSNISAWKTITVGFYTPIHKIKMGP